MKHLPNMMIDAAAGCGKTELLALRLLGLLLSGAKLDEVVAMTFTRSAAAEIYERLLAMLAHAVSTEPGPAEFKKRLETMAAGGIGGAAPQAELAWPEECRRRFAALTRDDLIALLRQLVDAMRRIGISTIDGFMNSLVDSYGVELGLGGRGAMLDSGRAEALKRSLLTGLLRRVNPAGGDSGILASCRDAAFGKDTKLFFEGFCELMDDAMRFAVFADQSGLWAAGSDIRPTNVQHRALALEVWRDYRLSPAAGEVIGSRQEARASQLDAICEHLALAEKDWRFSGDELKVMRAFFLCYADDRSPHVRPASFTWIGKLPLEVANAVKLLMLHGAKLLLSQTCRRTSGIGTMLRQYMDEYDREVTGRGLLQFSDLTRLLRGGLRRGEMADLAFRMNSRRRHWLLDEFQDTSRDQYEVFSGILSDLDREEESLFLVGDVKQALYGWRSGDSRLMEEASTAYGLERGTLENSYRYGPEIAASLNELFTSGALLNAPLPESAKKRWLAAYKLHTAAASTRSGEFAVYMMKKIDREDADSPDVNLQIARSIGRKLVAMRPAERRISCAVLVRGKSDGLRLKGMLEDDPEFAGIAPLLLWEGDESIARDRMVGGLLALCVWLQHPGNTLAAEQVRMNTALRRLDPDACYHKLKSELYRSGFRDFLAMVLERLKNLGRAAGETAAVRAGLLRSDAVFALLAAAREFDRGGDRDALSFRDFAVEHKISEAALAGKIRIMTIHHSKGLGFDAVFVPLTSTRRSLSSPDLDAFITLRAPDGQVSGLIHAPKAEGMLFDDVRAGIEEQWSADAFEGLCLLYVALTRARRSVNVYLPPAPKSGEAFYAQTLVASALAGSRNLTSSDPELVYFNGKGDWFNELSESKESSAAPLAPPDYSSKPRRRRISPSDHAAEAAFMLPRRDRGAAFGSRLHAFFAGISFMPEMAAVTVPADIQPHWEACRRSPEACKLLSRHGIDTVLWREKAFEIIHRGEWVSGCIDRAELAGDGSGGFRECWITDYKSNAIPPESTAAEAEKYRPQLELYRSVMARLLHLPPEKIHASLLFTACGRVFDIE